MSAWQPMPAPSLERVFVSGWQSRHRLGTAGYWWVSEDTTDDNGVPMTHADALYWQPLPAPPTFPAPVLP